MTADPRLHNFVVKPLQSPGGLDGAFRVHLLPEHLDQLRLKVGDLCEISDGEDGSKVLGYGIAWRANEGMATSSKVRHAKVSETLRTAFKIKEGTPIRISATTLEVTRADHVALTDLSPSEGTDDERWWTRCVSALGTCESIASGITFEVKAKKTIKRFRIDQIESSGQNSSSPMIFYCNDHTKIEISDHSQSRPAAVTAGQPETLLTSTHIGGLLEQLEELNWCMSRVLQEKKSKERPPINTNVLIHGYEGTGKSLILKKMENAGFRKVVRLEKSTLNAGTIAKNQDLIHGKFLDAWDSQPCLILMDNLEQIASATDDHYGDVIANELERLSGSNILVVAACRAPSQVRSNLVGPDTLSKTIEITVPDVQARSEILRLLLHQNEDPDGSLTKATSVRTHGFTGRDLRWLVNIAREKSQKRCQQTPEGQTTRTLENGAPKRLQNEATETEDAKIDHDQRKAGVQTDLEEFYIELKLEDFDFALTKVGPTALRAITFEKPQTRWSDIGGSEVVKEELDRIIGWPLYQPNLLKKLGRSPEKGVLLYGPPGCAKTLTAQAVATSYDLNFIPVKGAELVSMYVGESERAVRELFRKARAAAPCVIFLDEIDSIASERESSGTKGLNVVTTLLNEMDGFQSLKGVFVLAATNKPESLDSALMRHGRLGNHLYLGLPDQKARKEILALGFKDTCAPVIDWSSVEKDTEGYTGAEIVEICNVAKDQAVRRIMKGDTSEIQMTDFEVALRRTKKSVTQSTLDEYAAFASSARRLT